MRYALLCRCVLSLCLGQAFEPLDVAILNGPVMDPEAGTDRTLNVGRRGDKILRKITFMPAKRLKSTPAPGNRGRLQVGAGAETDIVFCYVSWGSSQRSIGLLASVTKGRETFRPLPAEAYAAQIISRTAFPSSPVTAGAAS